MTALGTEDIESQNRIAEQGGIPPLVRLLRSHKTSERVLLAVIKALGTLCIGECYNRNLIVNVYHGKLCFILGGNGDCVKFHCDCVEVFVSGFSCLHANTYPSLFT